MPCNLHRQHKKRNYRWYGECRICPPKRTCQNASNHISLGNLGRRKEIGTNKEIDYMVKAPLRGEKYYSGRDSSAGDSDNIDKVNSRKTNDDKNLPGAKKIRMGDNRLSKTDRDSGDGDSDYIDQVNSKKRNDGKILPAEKKMRIGDNSLSKIDERLKSLIGNAVNDITQHGNVKQKFSIILNILDVPDIEELLYNLSIKGFTKENILDKNSRMHRKFKEIQKNIA